MWSYFVNKNQYIQKWKEYNVSLYRQFLHIVGYTGDKTSRNLFRLFQIAIFFVIAVLLIDLFAIGKSSFGEWGDFFGGVLNPLLTFLTFLGLLITIILQQKELKQSRKEFEGQKVALQNQEFDNKFFQMLNLLNNITDNLTIKRVHKTLNGKDVFRYLKDIFHSTIQDRYSNDVANNSLEDDKFTYFKNTFDDLNNEFDTTFKYYFINLYQVLKYIDLYAENKHEAKEYTNMLRAQLTKNELVLLAYNAIGVQNFTTNQYQLLIEKYAFFEHLRFDNFCDNANIIKILTTVLIKYDNSAFGKNHNLIKKIEEYR